MLDNAFNYVSGRTQLCEDFAYPYVGRIAPSFCPHVDDCHAKVPFDGFDYVRMPLWDSDFEAAPQSKLDLWDERIREVLFYCRSPVAIAIFYDSRLFQKATNREVVFQVYKKNKCRQRNTPGEKPAMGHAMVIVGWTEQYWILQNSYGTRLWHLDVNGYPVQGFLRLERLKNTCGMFSKDSAYFFLPNP